MKSKFVKVRDTWTLIHFLVLEFEEVDREFAESAGFAPGLKVALRFYGREVSCIAGYDFGGAIQSLSRSMDGDGTTMAFKEILHHVYSVRALPDEIDVENWRGEFFRLKGDYYFMPPEVRNVLAEYPENHLRKVAYRKTYCLLPELAPMLRLAIVNVKDKELLVDIGCNKDLLDFCTAQFLWIPLEIATESEVVVFGLGPLVNLA